MKRRGMRLWGGLLALLMILWGAGCPTPFEDDPGSGGTVPADGGDPSDDPDDPVDPPSNPLDGYSWKLLGVIGTAANDTANTRPLSLAIGSDDQPVVAYKNSNDGHTLYVKKFNGTDWDILGSGAVSDGLARWVSLDISGNDPYVGYYDNANGGNGTVHKWDGTSWSLQGSAGEAASSTFDYGLLKMSSTGDPVTYFRDASAGAFTISHRNFDSTNWNRDNHDDFSAYIPKWIDHTVWNRSGSDVDVLAFEEKVYREEWPGPTMIESSAYRFFINDGTSWDYINDESNGMITGPDNDEGTSYGNLAVAAHGDQLYAAINDYNYDKLSVKVWQPDYDNTFGDPGNWNMHYDEVSEGAVKYIDLITDSEGNLIVAYKDMANGEKITVKKWIDTTWYDMGSAGFSSGRADWIDLAVDSNDVAYLAYRDLDNADAVTVMRFTDTAGEATLPAPEAPAQPTLTPQTETIAVEWTSATNATSYQVWYNTENNSDTASQFGDEITDNSTTITGLTSNQEYYVWVKAKNSTGTSDFSVPASATTLQTILNDSIYPDITPRNGALEVSWDAVEDATAYEVWYYTSSDSGSASQFGSDFTETTATITGLTNGTTYYVWVKAKNAAGISTGWDGDYNSDAPIGVSTEVLADGNSEYMARCGFAHTVYDEKMLINGGYTHGYYTYQSGGTHHSDDGSTWTYQEGDYGFNQVQQMMGHHMVVHNGDLYLFGKNGERWNYSEVWKFDPAGGADGTPGGGDDWEYICGDPRGLGYTQGSYDYIQGVVSFDYDGDSTNELVFLSNGRVYASEDGAAWTQLSVLNAGDAATTNGATGLPASGITERYRGFPTLTVFNNKIWLIGGEVVTDGTDSWYISNAVYSSADGVSWTEEKARTVYTDEDDAEHSDNDHFMGRQDHAVVVFDPDGAGTTTGDMLWMVNGYVEGGVRLTNAVYYSQDGSTWFRYDTDAIDWDGRSDGAALVFNDGSGEALWIMGGSTDSFVQTNDVWKFIPDVNELTLN